uniref:Rho-GAP domain-containing protein n=1 Tax=Pavo cristatus TaxID=9049 RepID=A0A8C9F929_PAVCR
KQWKEKKKKKKPVFGIPLSDAVDRTMMYDGIRLPAVFRECIDYVEKYGMKCEGIYRVSGIRSITRWLKLSKP